MAALESLYCRSCLSDNPRNVVNMKESHVTGQNNEKISLLEMFFCCTDIRIEKDHFSSSLCQPCANALKFAYEFRRQSQLTHSILVQKANKLTTATPIESIDISTDESPVKTEIVDVQQFNSGVELGGEGLIFEDESQTKSEVVDEPEYYEQDFLSEDDKTENTEGDETTRGGDATNERSEQHRRDKRTKRPRNDWRGYFCISYSCRKLFRSSKEMRNHLNANKGFNDHMYECDICHKKVEHKEGIRSHINQFHMELRCNECSEYLSGRYWYYTHLRKVHGKKTNEQVECPECKKIYRSKLNMQRHRRVIHEGKGPKKYPCPVCGKRSFSKMNLKVHLRVHSGERPYSCDTCKRSFKQQTTLRVHIASHATEKKYECEICGLKIKTEHYLKEHRKLHSSSEQYPCEKCGTIFKRLSYLKSHSTIHEEAEPEQCHVCTKTFKSKKTLRDHLRYHEEPKFACDRCNKAFIRSDLLREHTIATHEMFRRWICQFDNCDKKYFRSSHLRHHEKVVHYKRAQQTETKHESQLRMRQRHELSDEEESKIEYLEEAEEELQQLPKK